MSLFNICEQFNLRTKDVAVAALDVISKTIANEPENQFTVQSVEQGLIKILLPLFSCTEPKVQAQALEIMKNVADNSVLDAATSTRVFSKKVVQSLIEVYGLLTLIVLLSIFHFYMYIFKTEL